MTNTERELRRLITESKFEPITLTMKCNGDEVVITPCSPYLRPSQVSSFDQITYYLIDSTSLVLAGRDTLEEVAQVLLRYEEMLEDKDSDIEVLKKHIRDFGEDSDWGFVSDYHKDIFGHRPHVSNEQVIAWANSNSTISARYFA